MALWYLGPLIASASFALAFAYERRSLRKKREPWVRMLAEDAPAAAGSGRIGVLEGLASDGQGRLGPPLTAPFTGRPCMAFHIEIISRERHGPGGGDETVWQRLFEDARGQALVTSHDHRVVGRVDLRGAQVLLPPDLSKARVAGVTVFASSSSAFDSSRLPPHLAAFAASAGLPAATKDSLFSTGRNLIFNERIVVPGQPIVVAGPCVADPEGAGILVQPSAQDYVFFAAGSARVVRASAQETSLVEALWTGFVVALVLGTVTMMIVAFTTK